MFYTYVVSDDFFHIYSYTSIKNFSDFHSTTIAIFFVLTIIYLLLLSIFIKIYYIENKVIIESALNNLIQMTNI